MGDRVLHEILREPGATDPEHPEHAAWVERHGWCVLEGPGEGLCSIHPQHRCWFDHFDTRWYCFRWKCHNREHALGDPTTAPFAMSPEDLK